LALLQANLMFDLALTDDGLADATDIRLARDRRNVHRNLQRDFAIRMYMRCDVDIHAHIEILKLGIHQRVNTDPANTRLERSGRYRDLVADLQRSLARIVGNTISVSNQRGITDAHHRPR